VVAVVILRRSDGTVAIAEVVELDQPRSNLHVSDWLGAYLELLWMR
jgi:hypothetical protein